MRATVLESCANVAEQVQLREYKKTERENQGVGQDTSKARVKKLS